MPCEQLNSGTNYIRKLSYYNARFSGFPLSRGMRPTPDETTALRDETPPPGLMASNGNDDVQTVTSLLSIAKSTRAFIALLLAEIGLHPGQDQLLDRLTPGTPISVSVLASELSVRPSTVSKMLDRLIDRGLVIRTANKSDQRRTMVEITPKGETIRSEVREIWRRLETELVSALDQEQRRSLTFKLSQIDEILAQKLRRLR
ncbi:DNA-binding transcriptional regulator, MarR family [Fulvimarina manganoxydans]|uniref:DNA-binding transcriptional regulator, MarR family n=2 Tax=Fulvimarina manganoxydans TaxID=937218 RepID=A0A1W2AX57_9HYPH|nr:DNA-binding transcriptional regulator, MarR family [Fulvimarina manganoxydans]